MSSRQKVEANPYSAERESRVAAALRENLRKRKLQQQKRENETSEKSTEE
jgi:hypothetical protein